MRAHVDMKITGVDRKFKTLRFDTFKQARRQDVRGFIRFLSPDTITISAEGEQEKIEGFIEWCHTYFGREETQLTVQFSDRIMNYNDFIIKE